MDVANPTNVRTRTRLEPIKVTAVVEFWYGGSDPDPDRDDPPDAEARQSFWIEGHGAEVTDPARIAELEAGDPAA